MNKQELKMRYVAAGYADKDAEWRWDREEGAWCLLLKDIVLSEDDEKTYQVPLSGTKKE